MDLKVSLLDLIKRGMDSPDMQTFLVNVACLFGISVDELVDRIKCVHEEY